MTPLLDHHLCLQHPSSLPVYFQLANGDLLGKGRRRRVAKQKIVRENLSKDACRPDALLLAPWTLYKMRRDEARPVYRGRKDSCKVPAFCPTVLDHLPVEDRAALWRHIGNFRCTDGC